MGAEDEHDFHDFAMAQWHPLLRKAFLLPDDLENRLRSAFAGTAEALPTTADPWQRTTPAITRSRLRRPATFGFIAAAVALIAALVVVPRTRPVAPPTVGSRAHHIGHVDEQNHLHERRALQGHLEISERSPGRVHRLVRCCAIDGHLAG